jgi:HSP20 family protein
MAYFDDANKGFTSIFDLLNSPIQNFGQRVRHGNLPVDVYVTEDGRYVLKADMPGTSKGEISISFNDGILSIKAAHHSGDEVGEHQYVIHERESGEYERSISFPDVDPSSIDASFDNGTLTVILSRAQETEGHTIEVH